MQESQARKRKASPQSSDYAETEEEKKYVRTFRFLSVGRTRQPDVRFSADRRATALFGNIQIPLAHHLICCFLWIIPSEHTTFPRLLKRNLSWEQFPDAARRVVRVWLGQQGVPRQHLPGWSPSTYVGLKADTAKREAVVSAFRVRAHTILPLILWMTCVSSTCG